MFTPLLLQHLRRASLRRWVLACVLMAWGWVWAAPLLQPAGLHVVCKANGHVALVAASSSGSAATHASHAGDCPLCTPPSAAPMPVLAQPDPIAAAGPVQAASTSFPPSAMAGALPPARGPPIHRAHPERSDHV